MEKLAEGSDECLTHSGRNCSVLKYKCNGLVVGTSCKDWSKANNKKLKPGTDVANTKASGGGSLNTFHAIVRLLHLLTLIGSSLRMSMLLRRVVRMSALWIR